MDEELREEKADEVALEMARDKAIGRILEIIARKLEWRKERVVAAREILALTKQELLRSLRPRSQKLVEQFLENPLKFFEQEEDWFEALIVELRKAAYSVIR